MKKELINKIASDLNIYKFELESKEEYNQRLIFSSSAIWAKTLLYGNSINDSNDTKKYINVDKRYVSHYLSKVIVGYLNIMNTNLNWIIDDEDNNSIEDKSSNLASYIIEELINTYNIADIGGGRLTLPPKTEIYYGGNACEVFGDISHEGSLVSIGTSQWKLDVDKNLYTKNKWLINIPVKEYYQFIKDSFKWKSKKLPSEYKIFKLGYINSYSKCWIPIKFEELPRGISLLKVENKSDIGYILIKKYEDNLMISEIDSWYKENKEIYRILLALNYENKTPAIFNVKDNGDYKILYLRTGIPNYEKRIIISCSWPYGKYNNEYVRIIPSDMWEVVESQLNFLGITIEYY